MIFVTTCLRAYRPTFLRIMNVNVRTRGASSDYERAATRTIRNGHSSWHDPVWIKTQICITADFVPGRYLGTISSKLYKIKWPTRVNVQKIRWIPNIRHSSSFALGSTFDTQAKQLLRLGNTALDIHNHMILFGFCISSGSAEQGLAIRGNMNQISAVIYPGKARYSHIRNPKPKSLVQSPSLKSKVLSTHPAKQ